MIAIDATSKKRPDGNFIEQIFPVIKEKYAHQAFMADCSTYEEAKVAYGLGVDCIGTTLSGCTDYTRGNQLPDRLLIKKLTEEIPVSITARGWIWTPDQC